MMENKNDLQGWEEIEKELKKPGLFPKAVSSLFFTKEYMSALNDEKQNIFLDVRSCYPGRGEV